MSATQTRKCFHLNMLFTQSVCGMCLSVCRITPKNYRWILIKLDMLTDMDPYYQWLTLWYPRSLGSGWFPIQSKFSIKNLTLGTSLKRDHIVIMVGPHCALRLSGLSWSSLKVKHGSCKYERLVVTYDKDQLLIYAFRLNYTLVFGCGAEATKKTPQFYKNVTEHGNITRQNCLETCVNAAMSDSSRNWTMWMIMCFGKRGK